MPDVFNLLNVGATLSQVVGQSLRVTLVILLAIVLRRLARRVIPRTVRLAMQPDRNGAAGALSPEEQAKRVDTLSHVLIATIEGILLILVAFMVLAELGLNIAPVLAGAGIAGVAIGFGAQTLVRDVLAGGFILLENQYAKGDVVKIANVSGVVEDVNLRRTVLRDGDGIVHSVPNGEIRVSSNLTRGWSGVNLNVIVDYGEDLERVRAVINRVGEELMADGEWGPLILETPKVLRVDAFEESGIALKVLAKTKPMQQWAVTGELRWRLKAAFDAEGIRIPYPHRVVVVERLPAATREVGAAHAGSAEQKGVL